jgi:hypothetical protein
MIAAVIPLPGGTLLLPRLVLDLRHAPYFGEISILHQLSLVPNSLGRRTAALAPVPPCAWYILFIEATVLTVLLLICIRLLRPYKPRSS